MLRYGRNVPNLVRGVWHGTRFGALDLGDVALGRRAEILGIGEVIHLMPPVMLVQHWQHVTASLATTCDILSDEDAYLTSVAARTLRELTRRTEPGVVSVDAARLAACEVSVARRVVRAAILSVCPDARLEARHIAWSAWWPAPSARAV